MHALYSHGIFGFDTVTVHDFMEVRNKIKFDTLSKTIKKAPDIQFVCAIPSCHKTWQMQQRKQNSTSTAQQHGCPTSRLCRTATTKRTRCIQSACGISVRCKTWCLTSRLACDGAVTPVWAISFHFFCARPETCILAVRL